MGVFGGTKREGERIQKILKIVQMARNSSVGKVLASEA